MAKISSIKSPTQTAARAITDFADYVERMAMFEADENPDMCEDEIYGLEREVADLGAQLGDFAQFLMTNPLVSIDSAPAVRANDAIAFDKATGELVLNGEAFDIYFRHIEVRPNFIDLGEIMIAICDERGQPLAQDDCDFLMAA